MSSARALASCLKVHLESLQASSNDCFVKVRPLIVTDAFDAILGDVAPFCNR